MEGSQNSSRVLVRPLSKGNSNASSAFANASLFSWIQSPKMILSCKDVSL